MRNKKPHAIIITIFTLSSLFISLGLITTYSFINFNDKSEDYDEIDNLNTAGSLLIYSNVSEVFRLFETVNITVDAASYSGVANITIQIPYLNNTVYNYNMTWVKDRIFSYNYTPKENTAYNMQQIFFQVNDASGSPMDAGDEYIDIYVLPNCLISYNSTSYYKGSYLSTLIGPFNNSNIKFDWNKWNVSIVDSSYNNLFDINGDNINSFQLMINDSFNPLNEYYAKVNLYNNSQEMGVEYYKFEISNYGPVIIEPTIQISPNPVYRSSEDNCQVNLNVSDIEDNLYPGNITVKMILTYSADEEIEYTLDNNFDGSFELDFHIGLSRPAGNYVVNITAIDRYGKYDCYHTSLTIKNNPPVIDSYNINGYSTSQGISILYGQNLVFSFNVSDMEGIAYIRVALIDENNQWYNITQPYKVDIEVTVRTVQLITGVWYIYVFVIDSDGSITGLGSDYNAAPQAITIIPDVLSALLPWIALVIGLVVGIIAGVGAGYYRFKSKFIESQSVSVKKKAPAQKKPSPKKKPQVKPESIENETEEKPKVYEKKESEEKPPQRKIKRRL